MGRSHWAFHRKHQGHVAISLEWTGFIQRPRVCVHAAAIFLFTRTLWDSIDRTCLGADSAGVVRSNLQHEREARVDRIDGSMVCDPASWIHDHAFALVR